MAGSTYTCKPTFRAYPPASAARATGMDTRSSSSVGSSKVSSGLLGAGQIEAGVSSSGVVGGGVRCMMMREQQRPCISMHG